MEVKVHDSRGLVVPGLEVDKRRCCGCKRMLPWADFAIDRSKPSGHKSRCKRCDGARVLASYHAKRAELPPRTCSECGDELKGGRRVVCSSRCADRRFRRLHPEAYAERERAKVERRRSKRQKAREERANVG